MAGRLEATGYAPSFNSWDFGDAPRREQIIGRLPKLGRLVDNVTLILRAVFNLDQNKGDDELHNRNGPLIGVNLELAQRLTWISRYFHGVAAHYEMYVRTQNINLKSKENSAMWSKYTTSTANLLQLLGNLPTTWFQDDQITNNPKYPQHLPAEAPLELAVQICLNIRDAADPLNTPDLVQEHLRLFATANEFPGVIPERGISKANNHDGFSQCIFVTQSNNPRVLVAGSTVLYLGYIGSDVLANAFSALRHLRLSWYRYDDDLKLRFRNSPDTEYNNPQARYVIEGWPNPGLNLAGYVDLVTNRLKAEYRGELSAPGDPGQPAPALLQPGQLKVWGPFGYAGQNARSNFATKVFANQQHWFQPTPRCLKCRIIHDYTITDEDLEVTALPNESCKCAEDIVYGKLRQLNLVGNVALPDL
ncbi:hypothetical protein F4803DRAFT_555659 [Xylaria telfairii]|nr:hypothetical protein F4803DRAFT_555659 [Xylaria telfairii]